MIRATLLTKRDCEACDQAKAVLARVAADYPLQIETLDIDSPVGRELAAAAAFGFPPMLLIDQQPVSYGRLSERRLRRVLEHHERPDR